MTSAWSQPEPRRTAWFGTAAVALVIGMLYGAVTTIGHRSQLHLGDAALPWGIVAALCGVLALLLGMRLVAGGRVAASAAAVGIVGMVAVLTLPGLGGSVLIAGDLIGTIWSVAPALIAVLVIAWPKLPPRSTEPTTAA